VCTFPLLAAPVPKAKVVAKLLVATSDGTVTMKTPDGTEAKRHDAGIKEKPLRM
jgi:hypothetical protein